MASALSPASGPVPLGRRVIEWGLLGIVVLALLVLFLRESRYVQGQAELAAIRTTLAALRLGLVLESIRPGASGNQSDVVFSPLNPFASLQRRPVNYLGEMGVDAALNAAPGSWVFDPTCRCVGYVPIDPVWLADANGATTIWFRISSALGPRQLVALQPYVWQGQNLD